MSNFFLILILNLIIIILAFTGNYSLFDLIQISLLESISICFFNHYKFIICDSRNAWHMRNSDVSEGIFWKFLCLIILSVMVWRLIDVVFSILEKFFPEDLGQVSVANDFLMFANMLVIWVVLLISYLKHAKFNQEELQVIKGDTCRAIDKLFVYVLLVIIVIIGFKFTVLALGEAILAFMFGKILTDYLAVSRKLNLVFYKYRDYVGFLNK